MLVTLKVLSADVGATVTLNVDNGFDTNIPFDTIETVQLTAAGTVKRVFSDFTNLFKLRADVTGGNASYRVVVTLFDNAVTTRIENAQIDVSLDHTIDTLGHFDSIRIGDGEYLLDINPDGSINVNLDNAFDEEIANLYSEVPAIVNGSETVLISYEVPVDKIAFLYRVEGSGENVARYQIQVNGSNIATRRTYFGADLTTEFDYTTPNKRALELQPGDIIEVKVLHNRPNPGDFEARMQLLLKAAPQYKTEEKNMSLEAKRIEVQLANVRAARLNNELRVEELLEVIEKLKKDIQISLEKENELQQTYKEKNKE